MATKRVFTGSSLYREPRGDLVARGEVHLPGTSCGIRLAVTHDNEPVHASIRIPPIALYGSLDTEQLRRFRDWICRVFPGDMGGRYSGRAFELSIHDYAVWWDLGADDTGWTSARPRWRDGCWYPLGHRMRQGEPVQLEEREVLIPMPERSYRAVAKLHRSGWGFKKLPRRLDKIVYGVSIEMLPGEQIPFPGKGESSYDCGQDAAYGMSCPAGSIEEGIGHLVANVLKDRRRHGGAAWKLEAEAAE